MDLKASYVFEASPSMVWALLMDPEAIRACLPGCRSLRQVADDRHEAELAIGVGAVSGVFRVQIALHDKVARESYRLSIEGSGRPGFVKGDARIVLAPDGGRTRLDIESHADAGGMLARVGQRLLEGAARLTMDRFYGCLAKRLGQPTN